MDNPQEMKHLWYRWLRSSETIRYTPVNGWRDIPNIVERLYIDWI